MPLGFNYTLQVFLPKGVDDTASNHEQGVITKPEDTRPIGFKNAENKLIGSAMNWKIKNSLTAGCNKVQRGFTFGRQLLQNVTDLDTKARKYSMSERKEALPVGGHVGR